VKSKLTDQLLKELKPQGYNISCKDAIDRGAVHTLWHKMCKQYNDGKPMGEKEFLRYMDAAAILVKYRAVNHNRNLLWNALNERMKYDDKFADAHPWAEKWLKENNPALAHKEKQPQKLIFTKPTGALLRKPVLDVTTATFKSKGPGNKQQ
jgi:hypothetical protein